MTHALALNLRKMTQMLNTVPRRFPEQTYHLKAEKKK